MSIPKQFSFVLADLPFYFWQHPAYFQLQLHQPYTDNNEFSQKQGRGSLHGPDTSWLLKPTV